MLEGEEMPKRHSTQRGMMLSPLATRTEVLMCRGFSYVVPHRYVTYKAGKDHVLDGHGVDLIWVKVSALPWPPSFYRP